MVQQRNPSPSPTNAELAGLLDDHANHLRNKDAHDVEATVRLAAERLRDAGEPTPAVVALITALRQAAHETSDSRTAAALCGVLGEFRGANR